MKPLKLEFNDLNFGDVQRASEEFNSRKVTYSFAYFPNFLTPQKTNEIREYLDELNPHRLRRDFMMPTSSTWRHMSVVNGHKMEKCDPIMALYNDPDLRKTLSQITRTQIVDCANRSEHVIISDLHQKGDTHGRHRDAYPYALIICVDAPASGKGGEVEYEEWWSRGYGRKWHTQFMQAGDAYLMETEDTCHGVLPLIHDGDRRRILNLTYDMANNDGVIPDGSADILLLGQFPAEAPPTSSTQTRAPKPHF